MPGVLALVALSLPRARAETPEGMSLIDSAGKSFRMGDSQSGANWNNLPVRTVQFTYSFYLGQTEVTYAQWKEVRTWASGHGYPDLPAGQIGFDLATGSGRTDTAANGQHPVTYVSWYDVVKWCNARSEMLGRHPCYYTDEAMTAVFRAGMPVTVYCNWITDGYRIPTSAEWEYAARGGFDDGRRFPWGNDPITPERANYYGGTLTYEISPTKGVNPLYNGTAPVGSFPETGYHLRDMAGNVAEWVWDFFLFGYYDRPDSEVDPRGPGWTHCIIPSGLPACPVRGGAYLLDAAAAQCGDANQAVPQDNSPSAPIGTTRPYGLAPYSIGFRFAMTAPAAGSVTRQPVSTSAASGSPAALSLATAAMATAVQWYCNGKPVTGATTTALDLAATGPAAAGLYDAVVNSGSAGRLSRPAVVGVRPATGLPTAGMVTTRAAWQGIHHPKGNIYDQYLLAGIAGTFSARAGRIARMSFLDPNGSIVQVEMSGSGATTVVLEDASGPVAPELYNQTGIQYMKGKATIVVTDTDETTHVTVYSVGSLTNPGVVRDDVTYVGWANVGSLGIVSSNGGLGGIHQGNALYTSDHGFVGLYAPTVAAVAALPVVLHEIAASGTALPYLLFGDTGQVRVKLAGGSLAQPGGLPVTVAGLQQVLMGAGQDSCGRAAPAQAVQGQLVDWTGINVTGGLVSGP